MLRDIERENKLLRRIVRDQAYTIRMLFMGMPTEIKELDAWKRAVLIADRVAIMIDRDINVE